MTKNVVDSFGKTVQRLSRNPLGIIALFLVLVYAMAFWLAQGSGLDSSQRQIVVWFLVVFPILILAAFYRLVTRYHNKLYAPSDFADEANFMKALDQSLEKSRTFADLRAFTELIQKQINEQPLYRYTRLVEIGKRLVLEAYANDTVDLDQFQSKNHWDKSDVRGQAQVLAEEYQWLEIDGNAARMTKKGRREVGMFQDLCYGRLA